MSFPRCSPLLKRWRSAAQENSQPSSRYYTHSKHGCHLEVSLEVWAAAESCLWMNPICILNIWTSLRDNLWSFLPLQLSHSSVTCSGVCYLAVRPHIQLNLQIETESLTHPPLQRSFSESCRSIAHVSCVQIVNFSQNVNFSYISPSPLTLYN